MTPGVALDSQVETASPCGATGRPGFLSPQRREMDPNIEMRRENRGSFEFCQDPGCSSRLETGILGKFLSCIQGVKDLSRLKREGGISLETLQ